jgi:hypothetical protein
LPSADAQTKQCSEPTKVGFASEGRGFTRRPQNADSCQPHPFGYSTQMF